MTALTTAWMLGCVCGFFLGVTVASRRQPTCRELMRDPSRQPTFAELLMPLPRDRDPDWRRSINHENTNAPSGPPPLLMLKSPTVTVKGLNWPANVGDFTLVGRADNEGAWRWYERRTGRGVERVRLDHQLRPMGLPHPP